MATGIYNWRARNRYYNAEKPQLTFSQEGVFDHPLKQQVMITVTDGQYKKNTNRMLSNCSTPRRSLTGLSLDPLSALEGLDPLSQLEAIDPLSKMAAEYTNEELKSSSQKFVRDVDDGFEPWAAKKSSILSKFTTSEKLSIATSFLSGGEKIVKTQSSVSEKVKHRLEQLDDFEEGSVREMLNLTQQEYVHRIDQLNQALLEAWEVDQRVKALKIVIQCSKLLADTNAIQFYPSKFVLVSDILDTFGRLVYERLRMKAEYIAPGSREPKPLPENFTLSMVPESAKETCRNWFFKIASIRELLPRLYVETAILKSNNFLSSGEFGQHLMRLTKMTRGVGNPLVAAYARCYICRVGMSVALEERTYLQENLYDFLSVYPQLGSLLILSTLAEQKVDHGVYHALYSPAIDWILQCIARNAPESMLTEILDKCKQHGSSALLLNAIMAAFKPEYIANRVKQFTEMIKECDDSGLPKHMLFRTLGLCLVVADPPEEERIYILNDVWKIVTKLRNPADYMSCTEIWIEYVAKNFTKRELNTFLGDIIKHMTPDRAYESHYHELQGVVDKVLSHIYDFSVLFSMDKFLPFLDMFQKESVKVEVCKIIVEAFIKHQATATSDPVIINSIMFLCKTMHDSVNALTLEDEKRQISNMICSFLRKVHFGKDLEQQLSFCVESRANFNGLEMVLVQLVHTVNGMAIMTRDLVKGHHTKKTAGFVRACAAYSFITIPSLSGIFNQLDLYLVSGQVALMNQCLGQADACFKAAISLLPSVPRNIELPDGKQKSSETYLVSYISNFMSTLIVTPDHPDHGVLYLLCGLLNVLHDYSWEPNSDALAYVYLRVLALLSATVQESYIYHIDKIDSNDALYGSDVKFVAEVEKMGQKVLDQILTHLKNLGEMEAYKRQSNLAFELLGVIIAHGDLTEESLSTLTYNLWNLILKQGVIETKVLSRTLEYIKRCGQQKDNQSYLDLANRLQISKR